jgi:hypothetical protein
LPLTFSRAFEGVRRRHPSHDEIRGDRGLLRLAGPLVAGIGRRHPEGDFPKLKHLLERAT